MWGEAKSPLQNYVMFICPIIRGKKKKSNIFGRFNNQGAVKSRP